MKKYFAFLLAMLLALLLSACGAGGYSITEPYEYPILPGSEEWAAMKTKEERHAACQIPEEMLEKMSTEALIESIFTHPLWSDVINTNYTTIKAELERIEVFNGVQALYQREDGIQEMELKIQRIEKGIAEDTIELGNYQLLMAKAFLEKMQAAEAESTPEQP